MKLTAYGQLGFPSTATASFHHDAITKSTMAASLSPPSLHFHCPPSKTSHHPPATALRQTRSWWTPFPHRLPP